MPIIDCQERQCRAKVSTEAQFCPQCGFPMREFLDAELSSKIIGIPIDPFSYWVEYHIRYWMGRPQLKIHFEEPRWVKPRDYLMSISEAKIYSPVSGLLLGAQTSQSQENYRKFRVSEMYETISYLAIRLRKGEEHQEVGEIFRSLQEYLFYQINTYKKRKGFRKFQIKDVTNGHGLDPTHQFTSEEQLIDKARDLENVQALFLDV